MTSFYIKIDRMNVGSDRLHFTQKEEGRSRSRDGFGNFEREETLTCGGSMQANAFTKARWNLSSAHMHSKGNCLQKILSGAPFENLQTRLCILKQMWVWSLPSQDNLYMKQICYQLNNSKRFRRVDMITLYVPIPFTNVFRMFTIHHL